MTKKQKILSVILVVVFLFGLYIVLDRRGKDSSSGIENNNQTATTTQGGVEITTGGGNGGYTIEEVPVSNKQAVPVTDLSRLVFGSSVNMSVEAKNTITEKIRSIQSELKKDHSLFNNWIQLGIYQKAAGDFAGAALSWKYASAIATKDFISLGNLGNLYAYFLNDTDTAETYYKKAILNAPAQAYLYVQLAEMYRDLEKNRTKASAVVDQGLSQIPNDAVLLQMKASLK